ncbi:hypothetical protein PV350_31265 [Streptomyces sp. PA03-6a]|nr:hypothetical protein [Streptomyces sp. PA03-6a]
MSPEERQARAELGARVSWANTIDRTARTEAARRAKEEKYFAQAREMHPDATDEQVAQVAEQLKEAAMARMRLAAATARRKKAERNKQPA